jgi:hypothetical protein
MRNTLVRRAAGDRRRRHSLRELGLGKLLRTPWMRTSEYSFWAEFASGLRRRQLEDLCAALGQQGAEHGIGRIFCDSAWMRVRKPPQYTYINTPLGRTYTRLTGPAD